MKKNPSIKNLLFVIAILGMSILVFVSDVISKNVFGSAVGLGLIVTLCFAFGYVYSKFEKWNLDNKPEVEEKKPKADKKNKGEDLSDFLKDIDVSDLVEIAQSLSEESETEKAEQHLK